MTVFWRIYRMSPKGSRGKNIKITVSPTPQNQKYTKSKHDDSQGLEDLKEDLRLVKEERNSLKQEKHELLADRESLRKENFMIIIKKY